MAHETKIHSARRVQNPCQRIDYPNSDSRAGCLGSELEFEPFRTAGAVGKGATQIEFGCYYPGGTIRQLIENLRSQRAFHQQQIESIDEQIAGLEELSANLKTDSSEDE